jgi:CubicO group peptidase (beta-lactamase class C family)
MFGNLPGAVGWAPRSRSPNLLGKPLDERSIEFRAPLGGTRLVLRADVRVSQRTCYRRPAEPGKMAPSTCHGSTKPTFGDYLLAAFSKGYHNGGIMSRRILRAIPPLVLLCILHGAVHAQLLESVQPAAAGFSPERLGRMHAMVQGFIDQGKHAGALTVLARGGRIVDLRAYGYRDLETRTPMEPDTIVRIYSMSKVITSVAALQLVEEGRIGLDDPVSRYIPELKNLKVCTGGTAEAPLLADAQKTMTIRHLFTHTAGFAYEFSVTDPLKGLYQKAELLSAPRTLREFIQVLARLPLAHEPGTAYTYGVNTDVLGYLVEVVSGMPFETYLQERILGPLRMTDTAFQVPPEKRSRLAKIYESTPDGKLQELEHPFLTSVEPGRVFPSGGGGMFSTAIDYLRFAQMLLNGGALDGRVILGRKTVEMMRANHLTFLSQPTIDGSQSEGFGLGGSVRLDLARGRSLGSVGQFGWNGAATTTFRIDPQEQTVAMLLVQHFPYDQHGIFARFYTLAYAALVE